MEEKSIKQQIREFLKDPSKRELRIKYKGPRLNAGSHWYCMRNPFRMLWTAFIVEITRKLPPCEFKNNLLRMIGVKIGKDVCIVPDAVVDWLFPELIEIGDGTLIGGAAWIAAHSIGIDEIRLGRVKIGKQVMVASFVCNEPPTTIGDRAVLGMYAYVNKDVPEDAFVVGIPAQVKKDLKEIGYLKEFNENLQKWHGKRL